MTDQQGPPGGGDPFDHYADLSDLTEDPSLPPLEDPSVPLAAPQRSPLLTGLIVALLLVVLSIAVFQLLSDDDDTTATPPPAATDAPSPEPTDPPDSPEPSPDTTAPVPTEPLDTPATTVAISVPGSFEPYEAVGQLIPTSELTMQAGGIGPIDFGTPAREAIGRLIASLGLPDEDTGPVVSTGTFGACEGELERIVRWGPFVAVVVVDPDGTETFGGYRLDFSYGDINHEATDLATLSGLKAGQSVVALEDIYERFSVTYEVIPDLGTTFQLRSSTDALLLWGPVTSDDSNGIVLGIYAPDACGRFQ